MELYDKNFNIFSHAFFFIAIIVISNAYDLNSINQFKNQRTQVN